jgi:hypothetical protein
MDREIMKAMEERRIAAMQTLDAVVRYIRDTKPANLFVAGAGEEETGPKGKGTITPPISDAQMQALWQRWIGTVADVLEKANQVPGLMLDDVIKLFSSEEKK